MVRVKWHWMCEAELLNGKGLKVQGEISDGKRLRKYRIFCAVPVACASWFDKGMKGGHRILSRDGIDKIINLQPKGGEAKPYQVKRVRTILVKYRLGENDVDQV